MAELTGYRPKAILELYDDEQMFNVLAIADFHPEQAVYLGTRRLKSKRVKNRILGFIESLEIPSTCFFYSTEMLSLKAVIAELEHILELYPDIAIDITGGFEVASTAVGILAQERGIPVFRYDALERSYRNIMNCPWIDKVKSDPKITVEAIMRLNGSTYLGHGHVAVESLSAEESNDVLGLFSLFKKYYRTWPRLSEYLRPATDNYFAEDENDPLRFEAPSSIEGETKDIVYCDTIIMSALADAGYLKDLRTTGGTISFRYKNAVVRDCLIDTGSVLEFYVYVTARNSGYFQDVQISVKTNWDVAPIQRVDTINEIDVIAVHGEVPVFISCKAGTPDVFALAEIKTLARHFGGSQAKAMLVTMSDVRGGDVYLFQRACDMEVTMVDYNDIIAERLQKRLITTAKVI